MNRYISPICETIIALLNEALREDEETKIILIMQTKPFYEELFSNTKWNHKIDKELEDSITMYINIIKENIKWVFMTSSISQKACDFLLMFHNCQIKNKLLNIISSFVVYMMSSGSLNNEGLNQMVPFLKEFFADKDYANDFHLNGGFISMWEALKRQVSGPIIDIIYHQSCFPLISQKSSEKKMIFEHCINTLDSILPENYYEAFYLVFRVIQESGSYLDFLKLNPFKEFNKVILKSDNPKLLFIYNMFLSLNNSKVLHFVLKGLLMLIDSKTITMQMQRLSIEHLIQIVSQDTNYKLVSPSDIILPVLNSIQYNENIPSFLELCITFLVCPDFNVSSFFLPISKVVSFEFALKYNCESFFQLILLGWKDINKLVPDYLRVFLKDVEYKNLALLFSKSDGFFKIVRLTLSQENSFESKKYLMVFVLQSAAYFSTFEPLNEIISVFLNDDQLLVSMLHLLNSMLDHIRFLSYLINQLIKNSARNKALRQTLIKMNALSIIYNILNIVPLSQVFDLCISLSGRVFSYIFDREIYQYINNLSLSGKEANFSKLVFGVYSDQDLIHINLIFPSFIHKCEDFKLSSFYDMWICGQYGIDFWMNETKKNISQFPSIIEIAQRFLLPHHAKQLMKYPDIYCKSIGSNLSRIPVIEFIPGVNQAQIQINFSHKNSNSASVSFWLMFDAFSNISQLLFSSSNLKISIKDDGDVFCNNSKVYQAKSFEWYHIVIISSVSNRSCLYINNALIHEVNSGLSQNVFIGADENKLTWYIGGSIRVYSRNINREEIEEIFNNGVSSNFSYMSKDIQEISPTTLIPLFGHSLDTYPNARPSPVYSFVDHINSTYNGSEWIINKISHYIENQDISNARQLIDFLISIQLSGKTVWSLEEYLMNIGMLFHFSYDLFTPEIVTNVFSSVINHGGFDWDSIMSLILDPGIICSNVFPEVITQLFGVFASFGSIITQEIINNFFLFVTITISFRNDPSCCSIFRSLISKLNPHSDSLCIALATCNEFSKSVSSDVLSYSAPLSGLLYDEMIKILTTSISSSFSHYYIFRLLPDVQALSLMLITIEKSLVTLSYDVCQDFLSICEDNVSNPDAWSVALSIFSNSIFNVESGESILLLNHKKEFIPNIILMYSLIYPVFSSKKPTGVWKNILKAVENILASTFLNNCFLKDMYSDKLEFSLLNLLYSGSFEETLSVLSFNYSNFLINIKETHEKYQQEFEFISTTCPFPIFKNSFTGEPTLLGEKISNLLRNQYVITRGNKKTQIDANSLGMSFSLIEQSISKNNKQFFESWPDYCNSRLKSIDSNSLEHYFDYSSFKIICDCITSVLLVFFDEKEKFVSLIRLFCNGINNLSVSRSIFIMQSLIFSIIDEVSLQKLFSQELIDFISIRLIEGWFKCSETKLLGKILNYVSNFKGIELSETFIYSLIFTMLHSDSRLIDNQFELIQMYRQVIFSNVFLSNIHFVFILVSIFIENFQRLSSSNQIFYFLKSCFLYNETLKRTLIDSNIDYQNIESLFSNHDANALLSSNLLVDQIKSSKYYFGERILSIIQNSLEEISSNRLNQTHHFFLLSDQVLEAKNSEIVISRATSSCIRFITKNYYLFMCEKQLRGKELIVINRGVLNTEIGSVKSISLLSDSIFPTRRVEISPAAYKIPPFPNGNAFDSIIEPKVHSDLFPLWPDLLTSMLTIPTQSIPSLSHHLKYHFLFRFCGSFGLSPKLLLLMINILFDTNEKYTEIIPASFLYGVEPIKGIMFLSRTEMCFVPMMDSNENGVNLDISRLHPVLIQFYMSYIIAGYFGQPILFCGRPGIRVQLNDIISCVSHLWIQKKNSIEISALPGWNFVLIFDEAKYKNVYTLLKDISTANLLTFPAQIETLSPIRSALLYNQGIHEACSQWKDSIFNNFDYICLLNKFSKRSLCDYSQFYVFPWIISDYSATSIDSFHDQSYRDLSLPMGQIGPDRIHKFDLVFKESQNQYFYGTHYMHFGVVIYFMFRIDPFSMFSVFLHHGWDHPNRVFFSLKESWNSAALYSPADVKEMIPHMYMLPEMYKGPSVFPLDSKTDVLLPSWSQTPRDFTFKMQRVLESERVTNGLPDWIDLIFGFKSRGEMAAAAKNLFHPLCYPSDDFELDHPDQVEKDAAITCIVNFGQCPIQISQKPHSHKEKHRSNFHIMSEPEMALVQNINNEKFKFPISSLVVCDDTILTSTGNSVILSVKPVQAIYLNTNSGFVHVRLPSNDNFKKRKTALSPIIYRTNKISSASCMSLSPDCVYLAIGKKDFSVDLLKLCFRRNEVQSAQLVFSERTKNAVKAIAVTSAHFLVIAAGQYFIDRIDIGLRRRLKGMKTNYCVSSIIIDEYAATFFSIGNNNLDIWTISGDHILHYEHYSQITSIACPKMHQHVENRFFVIGCEDGTLSFINHCISDSTINVLKTFSLGSSPIRNIFIKNHSLRTLVCTDTSIHSIEAIDSKLKPLKSSYALNCPICTKTILQRSRICESCNRIICDSCMKNHEKTCPTCSKYL